MVGDQMDALDDPELEDAADEEVRAEVHRGGAALSLPHR